MTNRKQIICTSCPVPGRLDNRKRVIDDTD
jgi:hypothetical protein